MTHGCPTDGVFEDWIARVLARGEMHRLDAHVDRCAPCRARMVLVASQEMLDEPLDLEERNRVRQARLDPTRARSLARLLVARASGY